MMANDFMNSLDSLDVDEDGTHSPLDVLNIVNDINQGGSRSLGAVRPAGAPLVDVDGDKSLSPLDALSVINAINRGRSVGLSRVLQDTAGFATEEFIRIGTGQPQGSRFYQIKIDATLAASTSTIGDLFAVYVVDSNVPSLTLLNRGITSSPIFSLTAQSVETTPGLTTFDGQILTIDLSSITKDTAQLKLQLLNHDNSAVGNVKATPIANTVDPEGVPFTQQNFPRSIVEVGPTVDLAALTPALSTSVSISEVQWTSANKYEADVKLVNRGTAIGRDTVVVLKGLPPSVAVENASGLTATGNPYINLRTAIAAGGLGRNESSYSVRLKINNPNNAPFSITPEVLTGSVNRAPTLPPIADLTVMPGGKLSLKLTGQDPDGDTIRYSINSSSVMPTTRLAGDELLFSPTPAQIGNYLFEVTASDGALSVSQTVRLSVTADSNTTTRLSGKILDVSGAPIAGIRVEVGSQQALTQSDGSFLLNFGNSLPTGDTLRVRAELLPNSRYPFIAEKLGLLLEHEIYAGYNNQILRPVFLPILNSGTTINPATNQTVTQQLVPNEAPAAVAVRAGTLFTQQGTPFTGALSITEVPVDRTPISLPQNVSPDLVITIQPGEMTFAVPTPVTFPNRANFPPGTILDLWSINPTNGVFEIVGQSRVSVDGLRVETISGGIRNSSWHFAAPPPTINPEDATNKPGCGDPKQKCPAASTVDVVSGIYLEEHLLPSYTSQGLNRALTLSYSSNRATPSQVIRFNTDLPAWFDRSSTSTDHIAATVSLAKGSFRTLVTSIGSDGTSSDRHRWDLGNSPNSARFLAGINVDLGGLEDGVYTYTVDVGAYRQDGSQFTGASRSLIGSFVKSSDQESPYGEGWTIADLSRLVVEDGGATVSVIAGSTSEFLFKRLTDGSYQGPPTDFSILSRQVNGTFSRRMTDGTIYAYDSQHRLERMVDRLGNITRYEYGTDGELLRVIDPVGLVTNLSYSNRRLSRITLPDGRFTSFEVDSQGNLRSISDPDGSKRQFDYNSCHQMVRETTPRGFVEQTEYDSNSRVSAVVRADGSTIQYLTPESRSVVPFNGLNRTLTPLTNAIRSDSDVTIVEPNGNVVRMTVNGEGKPLTISDSLGLRSTRLYAASQLPTQIRDGKGVPTELAYDARGNLISVTSNVTLEATAAAPTPLPSDGFRFNGRSMQAPFTSNWFEGLTTGFVDSDLFSDVVANGYRFLSGDARQHLAYMKGDGSGAFGDAVISPAVEASNNVTRTYIARIDSDPVGDVVMIDPTSPPKLVLYKGQVSGQFAFAGSVSLPGSTPTDLSFADLDGDTDPDIIYAPPGSSVFNRLTNLGGFAFRVEANSDAAGNVRAIETGKFTTMISNQVVIFDGARIKVLQQDPMGNYSTVWEQPNTVQPIITRVSDMDRDGFDDIFYVTQSTTNSPATFGYIRGGEFGMNFADSIQLEHASLPANTQVKDFELTDFQRDNQTDALLSFSNGMLANVINGGHSLTLGSPKAVPPGGANESIATGGLQDFLIRRTGDIQILSADVAQIVEPTYLSTNAESTGPSWMSDGDFNADGNSDLVVLQRSTLTKYMGDGNGIFLPIADNIQAMDVAILAADINSDGRDDVIGRGTANGLVVSISGPDGQSESARFIDESIRILRSIAVGDINRDGFTDLVVVGSRSSQSSPSDSLYLYMSNNSSNFATYQSSVLDTLGIRSGPPVLEDLNKDGFLDLITVSSTSFGSDPSDNRVGIRFGNASGGLDAVQTIFQQGSFPFDLRLVVGDVNGDSNPDIVVAGGRFSAGSYMELLLNDGAGRFPQDQRTPIPNGFLTDHLSMADVNNDGLEDVVVGDGALGAHDRGLIVFVGSRTSPLRRYYSLGIKQSQESTESIRLVDIDSDSNLDLITTVFLNRPTISAGIYIYGLSGSKSTETLTKRFEYDSQFSQLTRYTDELGRSTNFTIDPANGNLNSITGPLGLSETFTYLVNGLIDTHRDSLGRITDYDYDARGRVVRVTYAKGTVDEATIALGYDEAGNITSFTDGEGSTTRFEFDPMRRMIAQTDANNQVTRYHRDDAGNIIRVTDALNRISIAEYDPMNRPTRFVDAAGVATRMEYDRSGNLVKEIDGSGNTTEHRYDVANRRIQSMAPDGGITRFRYDINNNLVAITDPAGNLTRYFYDERYRVVRELDPLGNSTYQLFDGADNLIAERDRNGRRTAYRLDARDRLIEERWLAIDGSTDANTMSFSYDTADNLLNAKDNYSNYSFTYDSLNRVKSVDNSGSPSMPSVLIRNEFNDNGDRTRMTESVAGVIQATNDYSYDSLQRLTRLTQSGTNATSKRVDWAFNALSQTTSISRFADIGGLQEVSETRFGYDQGNRLSSISHINPSDQVLSSFGYSYDPANRISQIQELNNTTAFGYDKRSQVTSANYSNASRTDETFMFDANGNRVESNAHGTAYRTGPGNRLTTDGVYNYEYDNEGNLTKRTEIATGSTREFQWDHRNRLTMLSDKNASGVLQQVVRYSYDSLGRRISKQVDTTPLDTVDAAIEQYVYDGEDVILDFVDPDGSGPAASQQTTRYLRGPGIDNLLGIESASGTNWVLQDHLGSTRALVSSAGVLVQSIDYDSFGKAIVTGSPSTRYLYTGRELDTESGLFYYRARYYDSSTGRFTNEDPIGFAGGTWNTQIYVDNSPISAIDPMGTWLLPLIGLIGYASIPWAASDFGEDIGKIYKDNIAGDCDNFWGNIGDALLSGLGLAGGLSSPFLLGKLAKGYPPFQGFLGWPKSEVLPKGAKIDRFGDEFGSFASPAGTPASARSLPPGVSSKPNVAYEVLKPLEVQSGRAIPWYGQSGMGTQYKLPQSVGELVEQGYLKEITR